jgi:hypothetical protein
MAGDLLSVLNLDDLFRIHRLGEYDDSLRMHPLCTYVALLLFAWW